MSREGGGEHGGNCNSFQNSRFVFLAFSLSARIYILSSYLWEAGGWERFENRDTSSDSLERQTLLRFTTVFRKMYRRAPRYILQIVDLVVVSFLDRVSIFTITTLRPLLLAISYARRRKRKSKEFLSKSKQRRIVDVSFPKYKKNRRRASVSQ